MAYALFTAFVLLAFTVQAIFGFGSTILAVSLGSLVLPLGTILPTIITIDMVQSTALGIRHRHAIDWRFLGRFILPRAGLGLPVGMVLYRLVEEHWLRLALGLMILTLALIELGRLRRRSEGRPLSGIASTVLLFIGGIFHGLFGTGGPLIVYVTSRVLTDKTAFRSTLVVLWGMLDIVVWLGFCLDGTLTTDHLLLSALLLVPLVIGIWGGEWLHHRIPAQRFIVFVYALLAIVGGLVIARA